MLPDLLLKHQHRLDLTAVDLVVLINITLHWWEPERNPFPRSSTIATRMGVDVRTVQRSLGRLEQRGIIARLGRSERSAEYDLSPLVAKLSELAQHDVNFLTRAAKRRVEAIEAADVF